MIAKKLRRISEDLELIGASIGGDDGRQLTRAADSVGLVAERRRQKEQSRR